MEAARQAQEFGGQVRKGETGAQVVYADRYTKTETNDQGEEAERAVAFMKGYTVFNVDQMDGLPERYQAASSHTLPKMPLIDAAAYAMRNAAYRVAVALKEFGYAPR